MKISKLFYIPKTFNEELAKYVREQKISSIREYITETIADSVKNSDLEIDPLHFIELTKYKFDRFQIRFFTEEADYEILKNKAKSYHMTISKYLYALLSKHLTDDKIVNKSRVEGYRLKR
jgi:hypothetical protein